jgi:hypothetical protein
MDDKKKAAAEMETNAFWFSGFLYKKVLRDNKDRHKKLS